MYFIIVGETCSCRLLIMVGDGLRCRVLGDEIFSACLSDAFTGHVSDTIFLITITIITIIKIINKYKKDHARNTHITQTGRLFKRTVPVDYACQ